MKIIRQIPMPSKNGTKYVDREFELTPQEMQKAYEEKLYETLTADVECQFDEILKTETLPVTFEELQQNGEVMLCILQNIRFRDVDEGYWNFIENEILSAIKKITGGDDDEQKDCC